MCGSMKTEMPCAFADGAASLALALRQNDTLTALNLWGNALGPEGVAPLAESLQHKLRRIHAQMPLVLQDLEKRGRGSSLVLQRAEVKAVERATQLNGVQREMRART